MSRAIKKFNGLNGTIGIDEVQKLADLAKQEGQTHLYNRLTAGLEEAKKHKAVQFNPGRLAVEEIPSCDLPGIDPIPSYITADEFTGLNKAVSPDDIYQYITDLILKRIEKADSLPWHTMWENTPDAANFKTYYNFESKKAYRGINFMLLNLDEFGNLVFRENPYFLTFKQIEKNKGKLRKGASATRVVYFTKLYRFVHFNKETREKQLEYATYNHKKYVNWLEKNKAQIESLTGKSIDLEKNKYLPILKYYNVFSGEDIDDIDFGDYPKSNTITRTDDEKIEAAEAIVSKYPSPPKVLFRGNQPAYYPMRDEILMTPANQFKNTQFFYSVFFHELTHSTGHSKRLDRGNDTRRRDGSKEDKKAYDFEELVAEMGSVFLCAESGILFHTRDQSAKYLSHYMGKLKKIMKDDNRFFFRAASASQAAADHILDRDKDGIPAYIKQLGKKGGSSTPKKEVAAVPAEKEVTAKETKKGNHKFKKEQTVQFSKRWGSVKPGAEGVIKELRKSVHGDPMYKIWLSKGKDGIFPETVLQLPKKKLTKKELEAANPAPKAIKPKSISVASAIDDILSLDKYKGISKIQANILYKYFKDDVEDMKFDNAGDSVKFYKTGSSFEIGNLKKETKYHVLDGDIEGEAAIVLTEPGRDLVASIKNRVESKRNQKQNYALFDGLNSYVPENINLKDALEFSKKHLEGKSIYHPDIGKKVKFTKPGIKKSIHGKGKITRTRLQLIYIAKDLLKKSRLYKTEKDNKNRSNVGVIYKLRALTTLDGKQFEVLITVQERENGAIYYDHTGIKLKRQNSKPGNESTPLSRAKLPLKENKVTKTKPNNKNIGLKSPTIEPKPIEDGQGYSGEKPRPLISGKPLKASDIANMDFEILPMDEGWENLFQTAPKNMRIAVWAKPKNGKTAACCNFAAYLTKFGPILYNFADQGINLSTKNLIEMSGMDKKPNAFITTTDKLEVLAQEIESTGAHHVVIDMINQYIDQGVTPHIFRKEILQRFPDVGFTLVMEVTKAGDFKGDQAWTHLVDQLVTIENYIMDTKGRYGNGEKITWEEGAQKYAPQRYAEIKENEEASPEPEIVANTPESEEVFDFNVY